MLGSHASTDLNTVKKGKTLAEDATKAHRTSRDTALLILTLGTGRKRVVTFTP